MIIMRNIMVMIIIMIITRNAYLVCTCWREDVLEFYTGTQLKLAQFG